HLMNWYNTKKMSNTNFGKPRPLGQVLGLSVVTLALYYGWYKWIIQEELRRYNGYGWSGTLCLLPFVIGVALPAIVYYLYPSLGSWVNSLSLLGIVWIYIVQFRLYRTVNELYEREGLRKPLTVWWLFIPGLNLMVGFRQIHFLSLYWASKQNTTIDDPVAKAIPLISLNI
ncbi:hypothetical protein, partial [Chroococcus sp. FPU101]|uniref:hypothetical protein n=1 Tax=Chroococcus sp. FPU101 TaxID=1974212 RepID=UPI001F5D4A5A